MLSHTNITLYYTEIYPALLRVSLPMQPPSTLLGSFLPPLVVAFSPVGGGGQANPVGDAQIWLRL